MAALLSDCYVLLLWVSSALTSCFAAVLALPFDVLARGLYMPVYSFGAFATFFILVFCTCGALVVFIDRCLFLLLVYSFLFGRCWLSLMVLRFSCSALCFDRVLANSCMYSSLGVSGVPCLIEVCPWLLTEVGVLVVMPLCGQRDSGVFCIGGLFRSC